MRVHAADDQALEVQLRLNAQHHVQIQRVVVGVEGARRRADLEGREDGRVHLQEAASVQECAQLPQDIAALDEGVLHVGIDDQVQIALAIAGVGVLQAVELLRQRVQRLGQQGDLLGVHAHLAGLGGEHEALHADDVADVVALEGLVGLLAHVVPADVDLNFAVPVQQVGKARLAHHAAGHHAARDGDLALLTFDVVGDDLRGVGVDVKGGDGVGIATLRLQRLQLFQTDAVLLGQLLLGHFQGVHIVFSHVYALLHKRTGVWNTCRSIRFNACGC